MNPLNNSFISPFAVPVSILQEIHRFVKMEEKDEQTFLTSYKNIALKRARLNAFLEMNISAASIYLTFAGRFDNMINVDFRCVRSGATE